jgi:hypothetical protein
VAKLVTAEPRLEEILVAGVPTALARPGRARPCAMLVFVNGVTAQGRRHPDVQRPEVGAWSDPYECEPCRKL